eukprot:Amastigsp_a343156_5.p7 type:complete len:106 gc:universal Amastigsp_a343156_5:369-52(-)
MSGLLVYDAGSAHELPVRLQMKRCDRTPEVETMTRLLLVASIAAETLPPSNTAPASSRLQPVPSSAQLRMLSIVAVSEETTMSRLPVGSMRAAGRKPLFGTLFSN